MWSGVPQWEYLRIRSQYSFSWENLVVLNTWAASNNEIQVFLPSIYCSEWGLWHSKSELGLCDLTQKITEGARGCMKCMGPYMVNMTCPAQSGGTEGESWVPSHWITNIHAKARKIRVQGSLPDLSEDPDQQKVSSPLSFWSSRF